MVHNRKKQPALFTPRRMLVTGLLLMVFLVEVFFRTWCGVQCIRTGYDISRALHKQKEMIDLGKNLGIELGRLQSPQVLGRKAREKFNLSIPEPRQVIVVP